MIIIDNSSFPISKNDDVLKKIKVLKTYIYTRSSLGVDIGAPRLKRFGEPALPVEQLAPATAPVGRPQLPISGINQGYFSSRFGYSVT